ncbi:MULTISPECIES: 2-hydroxyacid dehydrogenase [unclassified Nocardioides]|uniref:2-hydroxyacid dehydrogenase n=1 Tax=unclassified Nocardioides TaxID=2615069 RepID=UPI0009F0CB5C|nr:MULTISPECIES: D-glycerate dehydrogenase [unclassified Nocardioides]GAW51831.1 Glyoxylate reductase [Nocardioides sp. PD653-B2]GAW53515.1 Glyoxylate reductase [Nocardioides sp. PD653]
MKVLVTRPVFDEELGVLSASGHDVVRLDCAGADAAARLRRELADHPDARALLTQLTDRVDAEVLTALPRLAVVANIAAGYDNIDVAAADEAGVVVTNTPGVLVEATADLAIALMLAVARRVVEGDAMMREGAFRGWELLQHPMGVDVSGRRLGIVGMGQIGTAVAKRAHYGFGMEVVYSSSGRKAAPELDVPALRVDLDELFETSDVVSLHCPLTPDTRHLVDEARLRKMKPSAILVNTARGPLVDEEALARALSEKWIWGAGLDVFEHEPAVAPALLAVRERTVLTPHVGSATDAVRRAMTARAAANVRAVLDGAVAVDPVGTHSRPSGVRGQADEVVSR